MNVFTRDYLRVASIVICLSFSPKALTAQTLDVAMLLYEEQEAGTDVYPVRILVGDKHLRIDDGYDQGDYILLDRTSRRLYSVNHAERNILVVHSRVTEKQLPADLVLTQKETADATAPTIQGKIPVNRQLLANGELCLQVVVVPDLMDAAVSGMAEYAQVLGSRQLKNLDGLPESVKTPCYLSRYVYAPARHLRNGLPLIERDTSGYYRSLLNYKLSESVSAAIFALPDSYELIQLD